MMARLQEEERKKHAMTMLETNFERIKGRSSYKTGFKWLEWSLVVFDHIFSSLYLIWIKDGAK